MSYETVKLVICGASRVNVGKFGGCWSVPNKQQARWSLKSRVDNEMRKVWLRLVAYILNISFTVIYMLIFQFVLITPLVVHGNFGRSGVCYRVDNIEWYYVCIGMWLTNQNAETEADAKWGSMLQVNIVPQTSVVDNGHQTYTSVFMLWGFVQHLLALRSFILLSIHIMVLLRWLIKLIFG